MSTSAARNHYHHVHGRGGSRRHGVNESSRSRLRFLRGQPLQRDTNIITARTIVIMWPRKSGPKLHVHVRRLRRTLRRTLSRCDLTTPTPTPLSPHNPTMQMLFESSFSFCTQQVTTRLQSGEAATAGEEGANRTVARQSSRAAPAGGAAKRAGRISL